eukprot:TRINITY_DN9805_c0_g1_i1.p1 TRINITY_DN9805_c0_g1~~TRINITY_DN9805_c0_g1_i1.p1  ORF type:complete len:195 (+),score=18.29 TRINITY_DN9805_c0_g1_i1:64-648(+)
MCIRDRIMVLKLEPHPEERLLPRLKEPVLTLSTNTSLETISEYICKHFRLKKSEFCDLLNLYILQDGKFISADKSFTLMKMNMERWKNNMSDLKVYDNAKMLQGIGSKTPPPFIEEINRVIYYKVDWPPEGIYQSLIFSCCFHVLLSFSNTSKMMDSRDWRSFDSLITMSQGFYGVYRQRREAFCTLLRDFTFV